MNWNEYRAKVISNEKLAYESPKYNAVLANLPKLLVALVHDTYLQVATSWIKVAESGLQTISTNS